MSAAPCRPARALFAATLVSVVAMFAMVACDGQFSLFGSPTQIQGVPTASPSPSPTPIPSASATPNPCDPPVTAVHLSGPASVPVGETFAIDVTPVSASGPLEGPLDYCNLKGRTPVVESTSPNLRCAGACSGYKPQFLAVAVGPFSVRIRVDNASAEFGGQVTK